MSYEVDDGEGMPIDRVYPSKSQRERATQVMKKKKIPTQKEIDRQIAGLKKMLASDRYNRDTKEGIEAQLAVLRGEKEPDDYYQDESSEDYSDGDNDVWSEAERADEWLSGNETEDLFEQE